MTEEKCQAPSKPKDNKEDPGGARLGNFINYYQFNPAINRIKLLPANLAQEVSADAGSSQELVCLDIGCNSGELTHQLMELLSAHDRGVHMLGVDVDPQLIGRAKEQLKSGTLDFIHLDVMSQDAVDRLKLHLSAHNAKKFDVISCFSVSMWIHLNHGDSGLQRFIRIISELGKYVILEPQPWKCYQTAARRMRKLKQPEFQAMQSFRHRSEESLNGFIMNICHHNQMRQLMNFGETDWKRKLILFKSSD